jgi:hypothetical protein
MKLISLGFLICITFGMNVFAQQYPFTQKQITLPGLGYSAVAWGDYDRDGDLDVVLSGVEGNTPLTIIARNDNGNFTDIGANLPALHYGSVEWGDYDADEDLDLLLTGMDALGNAFTNIYQNANGTFTGSGISLPGVSDGQACWGDYNNDGLPDILIAGNMMARILKNEGNGQFSDINAPLPAVQSPMCCWCDYNNDGQADAFVCGDTGGGFYSKLFKNEGGIFTEVNITPDPFTGLYSGQARWADLDNDRDQDLVISGMDLYIDAYLLVYRNDGNDQFTKVTITNANLLSGSIDLGDYDADGLIDLIVMGRLPGCGGNAATVLLKNEGFMNFFPMSTLIPGFKQGGVTWGDYNNDGHSDLLFTGLDGFDIPQTSLFLNNLGDTTFTANTPPTNPQNLSAASEGGKTTLSWNSATDAQTPKNALSYNVLIGTEPNLFNVMSPLANPLTGSRLITAPGNVSSDTNWVIQGIPSGTYYFRVQAIDNGFMAGTFSSSFMFSHQPVGLTEKIDDHFQVFPNPCTEELFLGNHGKTESMNDGQSKDFSFLVFNSVGMKLCQGFSPRRINVSSWPKGIYFIRMQEDDHVLVKKIVKE